MLYIFKLLLLLINIDQETVLNWFGLEDPNVSDLSQLNEIGYNVDTYAIEISPALSLETLRLVIQGLWEKVQDGLSLADIENLIFFIAFIRSVYLFHKFQPLYQQFFPTFELSNFVLSIIS